MKIFQNRPPEKFNVVFQKFETMETFADSDLSTNNN